MTGDPVDGRSDRSNEMNRDTAFYDQLEKARRDRVTEAVRALLVDDDMDTAGRHLAWAETAARAAKAAAPRSIHQAYIAALILLVCLSLITLAWSLDKSGNPVKLVLRVDGVQLRTAESWFAMKDVPILGIAGRGFSEIGVPALGDRLETEFRLTNLIGRIQSLEVSKDARVDLDFKPGEISVYVWNGTLTGEIAVASAKLLMGRISSNGVWQDLKTSHGMPPETIRFFGMHSNQEGNPVRLDIDTTSALQFADLVVTSVAFSREDPPRSGKRASTLPECEGKDKKCRPAN